MVISASVGKDETSVFSPDCAALIRACLIDLYKDFKAGDDSILREVKRGRQSDGISELSFIFQDDSVIVSRMDTPALYLSSFHEIIVHNI